MKELVRVGIVGAGIMGSLHARVYSELAHVQLVGIADVDLDKAEKLARRYAGVRAVNDYHRLLDEPELDVLHVATPDFLHTAPVVDALKAGKHVLVEKPMATTVEDAREILQASRDTGRTVMVNYTHRWAAPYARAEQLIREGAIGKAVMVYARKNDKIWAATEMMSWTARTSCASYLSTHDIDLVLWFLKTDVESVYALGVKEVLAAQGIDTEDAVQALVRFKNGAIGTFESSWVLPNTMPATTDSFIEIVGQKGTIHVDRIHEGLKVATQEGYEFPKLSLNLEIDGRLRGGIVCALENLVEAIRLGERPQPDAENGLKIVKVSTAIQRSIQRGEAVYLEEL